MADRTIKTDRLGILIDQLEVSREISQQRLEGLTDAECFWEPVAGSWSIRRRGTERTGGAHGVGDWVLDFEEPEPTPAPVTTIAWRLGHLSAGFWGRWEWTFGERKTPPHDFVYASSATEMVDRLWSELDRWQGSIATLTDEQLDMVGFGQFPGLDPYIPFIGIVWWTNREFIHHMSEISLLRDLWASGMGPNG